MSEKICALCNTLIAEDPYKHCRNCMGRPSEYQAKVIAEKARKAAQEVIENAKVTDHQMRRSMTI